MNVLLVTSYWPNLHYFFYVLNASIINIEQFDNYSKQSYRNRTQILSANGILNLSIPIKKNKSEKVVNSIEISYKEDWQKNHWRAITSAYKNSPYFDFFEEDLKVFYSNKYNLLIDYNTDQLKFIIKVLKQKKNIQLTKQYESNPDSVIDLRTIIHPKQSYLSDKLVANKLDQSYYQTFENKISFTPNLSILDLLFNKGLHTIDYLKSIDLL
jgi:hypothetical protein